MGITKEDIQTIKDKKGKAVKSGKLVKK